MPRTKYKNGDYGNWKMSGFKDDHLAVQEFTKRAEYNAKKVI